MTNSEHKKWEAYYEEAARRDFERPIYKRCDEEDEKERGSSDEMLSM
jgi:hypothetical protein